MEDSSKLDSIHPRMERLHKVANIRHNRLDSIRRLMALRLVSLTRLNIASRNGRMSLRRAATLWWCLLALP